jgi:hypothetical protein
MKVLRMWPEQQADEGDDAVMRQEVHNLDSGAGKRTIIASPIVSVIVR